MCIYGASQVVLVVKNPPANAEDIGDAGLIAGLWRSPGGGHGNALQYSSLENPMDRGTWWATVHRVAQSRTQLKWLSTHTHTLQSWHHWLKACTGFFNRSSIFNYLRVNYLSLSTAVLQRSQYWGVFICFTPDLVDQKFWWAVGKIFKDLPKEFFCTL